MEHSEESAGKDDKTMSQTEGTKEGTKASQEGKTATVDLAQTEPEKKKKKKRSKKSKSKRGKVSQSG